MTLTPKTIRAKLTLTAVAVMAVLFIVLGWVVQILGREEIMGSVDSELARRANEIIQIHNDMRRDRPPPPMGQNLGPGGDQRQGPRLGQGPGDHNGDHGPDGPNGRDRRNGPGGRPGDRFGGFQRAVAKLGDPLLAIGPRFVSITPGPPFAPPDMMVPYDANVIKEADKKGVVYSTILLGQEKVRLISKRAVDENGRHWLVQYPYPLGDIDKALKKLAQTLLILLPFGLILTAVASLFLVKRIMRPIREITETADSIGADNMSGRLTVVGADEFGHLADTMNGMFGRIEAAFAAQKVAMQKLELIIKQQRRFTADASHELKTPLAVIKANTGLMLHGMPLDEDSKESVTAIDTAATRMNRLVQDLMVLARAESGLAPSAPKLFDLNLTAQNAIDQVYRAKEMDVTFTSDSVQLMVEGIESDIERVFINLIDNACRHTQVGGKVGVHAFESDRYAVVQITDSGEGIAAEHLSHLFDRFYRVDDSRSSESGGTGLGLAICKGIVESHHGEISVSSTVGEGTTMTVRLPMP